MTRRQPLLQSPRSTGQPAATTRSLPPVLGAPKRALVVEDDFGWCELLADVLAEQGLIAEWASGTSRALAKVRANPDGFDCVIVDAGMYGGGTKRIERIAILDELKQRDYNGSVLLLSGLFSTPVLRRVLSEHYPDLRASGFSKSEVPIEDYVSSVARRPSQMQTVGHSELQEIWRQILEPGTDPSGKLLESAVEKLFADSGHFSALIRNHTTPTGEYDLILVHTPSGTLGREIIGVVECKNIRGRVDAATARILADKMRELHADFGVVVSRSGLTGTSRGGGARRLLDDLYNRDNLPIISLDYSDCLRIASGEQSLIASISNKLLSVRLKVQTKRVETSLLDAERMKER